MIALLLALATASTWEQVERLRNDADDVEASMVERAEVQGFAARLVAWAAQNSVPPDLEERCLALSLTCERGDRELFVHSQERSGRGLLVLRLGHRPPPLVLVAPHGWYDLNTGRMAADWFDDGYARALVINTAHRYGGTEGPRQREFDVAHRVDSLFQALALGVADGLADPLVVELHGFSERHGDFSAVVSDGEALQPDRVAESVAQAVEATVGGEARRGRHVPLLAATQNAQGRALSGWSRFVHLELSRDARTTLRSDDDVAKALGERLAALAEAP